MKELINQNIQYFVAVGFYENGISLARKINDQIGNKAFEIAPVAAVNISFATELLLKLLYHLESNKTIHEHRLDKIFKSLDKNIQQEIEEKYLNNKLLSPNDIYPIKFSFNTEINNIKDQENEYDVANLTLENLLKVHSNGFINWRYLYEVEDKYYNYEFNFNLMNEFIKALLYIINKKSKNIC